MSVLKQKGVYALVYTNTARAAKSSNILAMIRICYGSDEDSIAIAYVRMEDDQKGYQVASGMVTVNNKTLEVPLLSGKLFKELVDMAKVAMERVKTEYQKLPAGKLFKVYRNANSKNVVEQIGGEGEEDE